MTQVMAYIILLSATVASVATVADLVARARRRQGRWTWLAALTVLAPVTAFVMVAPAAAPAEWTDAGALVEMTHSSGSDVMPVVERGVGLLPVLDSALAIGWVLVSLALLGALAIGQWRLARARRGARRTMVQGRDVLLTEDLGPAVAGIAQPVVLVPRWVSALDDQSQRLLLAHEFEHAKERDTSLLMAGVLFTALMPWNPVVWWMARRLRIAVEMDCDRRVLDANPAVRPYVDLLLLAAARHRLTTRLLAAHFGEHASDLERRIHAMTETRWPLRPLVATCVVSALLIVAACESPRPDPVAPGLTTPGGTGGDAGRMEVALDRPVTIAQGSRYPQYPRILREAGVEGRVLTRFTVDARGIPDAASIQVVQSTHELFATAVRATLPDMRFEPAMARGKAVAMQVEQPFTFSIVNGNQAGSRLPLLEERPGLPEVHVSGIASRPGAMAEPKGAPGVITRQSGVHDEMPSFVIRSSDGAELRRYPGGSMPLTKSPFGTLDPRDIESIEVFKPTACPAALKISCPLIEVRVKPGREAAYKARD